MALPKQKNILMGRYSGITLAETLVALAILATIALVFLGGIFGTTKAAQITDTQTTAESIAQSQMESVQNATYVMDATDYAPAALPQGVEYANYSVDIAAAALHHPDDYIQKITVTVFQNGKQAAKLEGYKVSR